MPWPFTKKKNNHPLATKKSNSGKIIKFISHARNIATVVVPAALAILSYAAGFGSAIANPIAVLLTPIVAATIPFLLPYLGAIIAIAITVGAIASSIIAIAAGAKVLKSMVSLVANIKNRLMQNHQPIPTQPPSPAPNDENIGLNKQRLEAIAQQIADLTEQSKEYNADLNQKLATIEKQNVALMTENTELKNGMQELKKELETITKKINDLPQDIRNIITSRIPSQAAAKAGTLTAAKPTNHRSSSMSIFNGQQ